MPTCPDCGEPVAGDDRRCPACGVALADAAKPEADGPEAAAPGDERTATADGPGATTDDLSARAAGARVDDEEYLAPPGEWEPPDAVQEPARERPDVAPLGAVDALAWAARALVDRPVAALPAAVGGVALAAAAGAAYGLVGPPAVLAPRTSPAAVALAAVALAATVPGVAAAALVAEAAVGEGSGRATAADAGDGRALLRAAVPRLRGVGAATLASVAVTFTGYVFFVLPGVVLGPKVSLAPYAAAIDGTGPVESVERSWRRTRGRLETAAGVLGAATAVAVVPFALAPVVAALVAPLAAAVAAVALGRVYLEDE